MNGELEQLGERIVEHAAHLDAATHRLLADLRDVDRRGGWHAQGALSCAHWLAWRVGWDLVTARPLIDDALRRGELSYAKVRALLRIASPANEAMILEHARLMTASQLEKLSRKYALVQRHGQELRPQDDEQRRYVRRRDTEDGMVKIEAVLHPEEAELVWSMLDHAAKRLGRASHREASASPASAESRGLTDIHAATTAATVSDVTAQLGDDSAGSRGTTCTGVVAAPVRAGGPCAIAGSVEPRGPAHTAPTGLAAAPGQHQQVDATRRAFSRADALLSVAQAYLRGDRPHRVPIEVTITIPAGSLRRDAVDTADVADAVDVGWMVRLSAQTSPSFGQAPALVVREINLGGDLPPSRPRRAARCSHSSAPASGPRRAGERRRRARLAPHDRTLRELFAGV